MSFEEKYELFMAHQDMVYEMKVSAVRAEHPEWSEEEVEAEVARQYIHARPS